MKPWLKEICDQVEDGTALPARIDDALAVFRRWGFDEDAPLFTMAGELVAMLIERCEQQDAELSRLRTLEAAAIEWAKASDAYNGTTTYIRGPSECERQANSMRDAGAELERLCREAAEKARNEA